MKKIFFQIELFNLYNGLLNFKIEILRITRKDSACLFLAYYDKKDKKWTFDILFLSSWFYKIKTKR